MPCNHSQENPGAALGLAPPLLPIAQRTRANTQKGCELGLTKAVTLSQYPHVWLIETKFPGGIQPATKDGSTLPDTLQKLREQFFSHGYSIS
ncbi:MAG: hypothetical protein AB1671_23220, partial [Thermodesulfobacteriota bacterium]